MLRLLPALVSLAVGLCLPLAASWLLEGLVASWVMPDADGGQRADGTPAQRTQPLHSDELTELDEPQDFAPFYPHRATPPPSRRERRTWRREQAATRTVQSVQTTSELNPLLGYRRRAATRPEPSDSEAMFRQKERRNRHACMQRFICEVHIQQEHQLEQAGQVERNIVSILRKLQLQSPDSELYQYSYAAHMGQLLRGSAPSACHQLFSNCPYDKNQLLELMAAVRGPAILTFA